MENKDYDSVPGIVNRQKLFGVLRAVGVVSIKTSPLKSRDGLTEEEELKRRQIRKATKRTSMICRWMNSQALSDIV